MGRSPRAEEAIAMIEKDSSKILQMAVGPHQDVKPGQYIARAEAQEPPKLSLAGANGEYLAVCLDLDAPFISFPFLGPIAHWIQSGLKPAASSDSSVAALECGETRCTCEYGPPGPPPGAAPHRYVFMLFAQPPAYDVEKFAPPKGEKFPISKRMRFSLETFETEANVGPVLAANYFVSN